MSQKHSYIHQWNKRKAVKKFQSQKGAEKEVLNQQDTQHQKPMVFHLLQIFSIYASWALN